MKTWIVRCQSENRAKQIIAWLKSNFKPMPIVGLVNIELIKQDVVWEFKVNYQYDIVFPDDIIVVKG